MSSRSLHQDIAERARAGLSRAGGAGVHSSRPWSTRVRPRGRELDCAERRTSDRATRPPARPREPGPRAASRGQPRVVERSRERRAISIASSEIDSTSNAARADGIANQDSAEAIRPRTASGTDHDERGPDAAEQNSRCSASTGRCRRADDSGTSAKKLRLARRASRSTRTREDRRGGPCAAPAGPTELSLLVWIDVSGRRRARRRCPSSSRGRRRTGPPAQGTTRCARRSRRRRLVVERATRAQAGFRARNSRFAPFACAPQCRAIPRRTASNLRARREAPDHDIARRSESRPLRSSPASLRRAHAARGVLPRRGTISGAPARPEPVPAAPPPARLGERGLERSTAQDSLARTTRPLGEALARAGRTSSGRRQTLRIRGRGSGVVLDLGGLEAEPVGSSGAAA